MQEEGIGMRNNKEAIPAALFCISLGVLAVTASLSGKSAHGDEIWINGKRETATCETLYSEPITVRCFSEQHVCNFYPETGQVECVVK